MNNVAVNEVKTTLSDIKPRIRKRIKLLFRPIYNTDGYKQTNTNKFYDLNPFLDMAIDMGFDIVRNTYYYQACESYSGNNFFFVMPDLSLWNCYAIDTVRIIPVQLSQAVHSTLQKMQDNKNDIEIDTLTDQEGFEDIQALANQDILFHVNNYCVENSFRELNISLMPTLGCNMNCKYCYSSRKNENKLMSSNIINDAINYFCNNFSFSFCRVDFVSGGEPLCDSESLVNMVNILSGTLNIHNKNYLDRIILKNPVNTAV